MNLTGVPGSSWLVLALSIVSAFRKEQQFRQMFEVLYAAREDVLAKTRRSRATAGAKIEAGLAPNSCTPLEATWLVGKGKAEKKEGKGN